jgi:hypothetical protein
MGTSRPGERWWRRGLLPGAESRPAGVGSDGEARERQHCQPDQRAHRDADDYAGDVTKRLALEELPRLDGREYRICGWSAESGSLISGENEIQEDL